jgi:hypothetical protein
MNFFYHFLNLDHLHYLQQIFSLHQSHLLFELILTIHLFIDFNYSLFLLILNRKITHLFIPHYHFNFCHCFKIHLIHHLHRLFASGIFIMIEFGKMKTFYPDNCNQQSVNAQDLLHNPHFPYAQIFYRHILTTYFNNLNVYSLSLNLLWSLNQAKMIKIKFQHYIFS